MQTLNYSLFDQKFNLMSDLLSFAPQTPAGRVAYYEIISELSDRRFEQVCEAAMSELSEFPKPAWVLNRAREIANAEHRDAPVMSAAVEKYSGMPEGWAERVLANIARNHAAKPSRQGWQDMRDFESFISRMARPQPSDPSPVPVDEYGNVVFPDIDVDAQAVEVDDEPQ